MTTPSRDSVRVGMLPAPPRMPRIPAMSSVTPARTAHAITMTKKSVVVRHGGRPAAMPAAAEIRPRSTAGHRAPAGYTSHAAARCTRAVARANPLKTARPTAAEWSLEKVIITAAIAAKTARATWTWRTSKAREDGDEVTMVPVEVVLTDRTDASSLGRRPCAGTPRPSGAHPSCRSRAA